MKIHELLIGLGLFSLIMVVFITATANIAANYGRMGHPISFDSSGSTHYAETISSLANSSESIEGAMHGPDTGGTDAATVFLGGAWSAVQYVFSSFSLMRNLVMDITDIFHLPAIFQTFLIAAFILTFLFTIIYMLFKSTGE